jgi:hypothetical protein
MASSQSLGPRMVTSLRGKPWWAMAGAAFVVLVFLVAFAAYSQLNSSGSGSSDVGAGAPAAPTPAPSGPSAPGAPTLANVTYKIGAWTQEGRGGVRLSSPTLGLLRDGEVATWTISEATKGPAGHWQRAGANGVVAEGPAAMTPQPSGAGAGARLSGKTYDFKVTAQNARGSSSAVITIVVEPDAASMGTPTNVDNYPGAVVGSIPGFEASSPNPKSILISRGAARPQGLVLAGFKFSKDVTLRDADPAHPSIVDNVYVANSSHIRVSGVTADSDNAKAGFRFGVISSSDVTFENCQAGQTPASLHRETYGFRLDGSNISNITIRNCTVLWQYGGLIADAATKVTVKGLRVRWWHQRGIQLGNVSDWLLEDVVLMSPRTAPGDSSHLDFIQFNDFASLNRVTLRRVMMLTADADQGGQGLFAGQNDPTDRLTDLEIDGLAYGGWMTHGLAINGNGGNSRIHNFTLIKTNTGDAKNAPSIATFTSRGPWIRVFAKQPSNWAGEQVWDHGVIYDDALAEGFAKPRFQDTLRQFNREIPKGAFLNGDPRRKLESIPFAEWEAMSIDQVIETYRKALLPGPKLQNRDGSYSGAFKPNGDWNDQ